MEQASAGGAGRAEIQDCAGGWSLPADGCHACVTAWMLGLPCSKQSQQRQDNVRAHHVTTSNNDAGMQYVLGFSKAIRNGVRVLNDIMVLERSCAVLSRPNCREH